MDFSKNNLYNEHHEIEQNRTLKPNFWRIACGDTVCIEISRSRTNYVRDISIFILRSYL
jgi:hypothetical protein